MALAPESSATPELRWLPPVYKAIPCRSARHSCVQFFHMPCQSRQGCWSRKSQEILSHVPRVAESIYCETPCCVAARGSRIPKFPGGELRPSAAQKTPEAPTPLA